MYEGSIEKLDRDLLSPSAIESLRGIYPSIIHDWKVKPIFRTETEARISVLNEIHFPDPHAKYWQSVREQQVHFDQLIYLSFEYRRKKVELAKLDKRLKGEQDDLERQLLEIDREQLQYEIMVAEKVAKERIRELKQAQRIKAEQKAIGGFSTENADDGIDQLKTYAKTFILEMFNSGNKMGAADAQNIIGKAVTAKNRCKDMGIWDEVVSDMGLSAEQLKALGE